MTDLSRIPVNMERAVEDRQPECEGILSSTSGGYDLPPRPALEEAEVVLELRYGVRGNPLTARVSRDLVIAAQFPPADHVAQLVTRKLNIPCYDHHQLIDRTFPDWRHA